MLSTFRAPAKDIELANPPTDSISNIAFSPTADILAVASWDNNIRLYDVNSQGQNQGKAMYSHQGPVLDLTWSADGQYCFSAGCDNAVQMYNVQTQQPQQVAQHDAPIKCVEFAEVPGSGQVLITAGWDKKLKYWDLRSSNPIATIDLSDRAYSMDVAQSLLVCATGDRQLHIINLSNPTAIFKSIESPLKWQTRVVSCFPTGDAFAVGSIEGRVAIQRNFSFKCHRYDIPTGTMPRTPAISGSQNVFAINTLTFHKIQGTFCSGGSDGSLTFWDGISRTKLKSTFGTPIVSSSFNHNQEIIAYALSYDWSKGHGGVPPAGQNTTKVMLHHVKPEEVNKKPKRA
nr:mRNA export factor [Cryptococcus depauperatus CBS 7855]